MYLMSPSIYVSDTDGLPIRLSRVLSRPTNSNTARGPPCLYPCASVLSALSGLQAQLEPCPACGAVFENVEELVRHVDMCVGTPSLPDPEVIVTEGLDAH